MKCKKRRLVQLARALARVRELPSCQAIVSSGSGPPAPQDDQPHVVRIPRYRADRRCDHLRRHVFRGVDEMRRSQQESEDPPPPPPKPVVLDQYI